MRRFMVLLKKELKELLTPQILLPLFMVVIVFMFIGNIVGAEQEKSDEAFDIGVVDADGTETSKMVLEQLEAAGFVLNGLEVGQEGIVDAARDSDIPITILIPEGFEDGLDSGEQVWIQTYSHIRSFSFIGLEGGANVGAVLGGINEAVSDQLLAQVAPGHDANTLKRPVQYEDYVIVGDKSTQASTQAVIGFVVQQTTLIPMVLFIVIVMSAQMIATTVAAEKENKTLEMLLAAPVGRGAIVSAKMMAAGLVALLSAAVYMLGMRQYMEGVTGGIDSGAVSAIVDELGLVLGAGDYVLMGLTLFFGILVALAVSLILGSFIDSVRAVGAVITPLMIFVMIPYLLTLFLDFNTLSSGLRYLVLAIPFSYLFMVMPNLFLGNTDLVYFGIVYQAVWFVIFVTIAARIFSSDRILTMKLRLKRGVPRA